MTKAKKTRKFAVAKKVISPKDGRVKSNIVKAKKKMEEAKEAEGERIGEERTMTLILRTESTSLTVSSRLSL